MMTGRTTWSSPSGSSSHGRIDDDLLACVRLLVYPLHAMHPPHRPRWPGYSVADSQLAGGQLFNQCLWDLNVETLCRYSSVAAA